MKMKRLLTLLFSACLCLGLAGLFASCNQQTEETPTTATVHFDVNTEYSTNSIKDKTVTIGKRVSAPKAYILDENPDNLQVYGWYTSADCAQRWDFKSDRVQGDMTLYAKWVEMYTVSYYANEELIKTEPVFNGDKITEDATLVAGYKYLGSYANIAYITKFDYEKPITKDTNVYIRHSEGLYLSDMEEEGLASSGKLTDYLAAYVGSYGYDEEGVAIDEEGWVEEYTVKTAYAEGEVEEACTYVNFGYTPSWGDPFVEISLGFDISKSQIIRVYFKNLGAADEICAYFTAMLDVENGVYSETGATYSQDFCYPNHTGNPEARLKLSASQMNMDESAEWTYVDLNLYEIYKNGYSIWGTSPYLGALRIQANYKSQGEEDFSNVFLIKSIEGIAVDIPVEDSQDITKKVEEAKALTAEEIEEVSSAQADNPQGIVFPKDWGTVESVSENAKIYPSKAGLLFYSDNELIGRETGNTSSGFTVSAPEGKEINLAELTTLNVALCNYGYAKKLIVYVYNNEGIPVKTEIEIASQMAESKSYTVNLYGKFGMEGTLSRVELEYSSLGVDNLILFEEISFSEFVPYDIAGINFNDKFCYGFASTDAVSVEFDGDREGSAFIVSESGASIVSADKSYKATTDGYAKATLQYYLPKNSSVYAVTVQYKIGGAFTSGDLYVLDEEEKGKVKEATLPFKSDERGTIEAIKLTFEGTGSVILKRISFEVGETSLPFYESYEAVYKGWADWLSVNCGYEYDSVLEASIFRNKTGSSGMITASLYIGITQANQHVSKPHTTYSVLVTETTKVKIVYQNRTSSNLLHLIFGFDTTDSGATDGSGIQPFEVYNNEIDSGMQEYEWSTLTVEIPTEYVGKFLGKVHLQFAGSQIAIRAISIETE